MGHTAISASRVSKFISIGNIDHWPKITNIYSILRMFAAKEKVFKLFLQPLFFDSKIQHKPFDNILRTDSCMHINIDMI